MKIELLNCATRAVWNELADARGLLELDCLDWIGLDWIDLFGGNARFACRLQVFLEDRRRVRRKLPITTITHAT